MSGVAEVSAKYLAEAASNPIPIGYKQTDVGLIPEDWKCVTLGEIGDIVRGGSPRPAGDSRFFNGDFIPWLTVASLTNIPASEIYVTETISKLTELGSLQSRTLEKGTLIISNSGATLGVAKILGIKCCANDGVAAIINQKMGVREFLVYYFNTQTKKLHDQVATGNGQPNLNTDLIKNIAVPFPNEKEQTAIANALSDVDALISELEKLIAKKQAIKTATMQQLLTGRTRLPQFALREDGTPKGTKPSELGEIPEDWELQSLQEMATANGLVRGPFGGAIKKEHFTKTGYKVYEQRNAIYATIDIGNYFIDQKKFDELKRFSVSSGDFIVSCSGTIGRIYQIPEKNPEGVINQALLKITLNDNINSKYFHHYFKWDEFQERIIDGTQGGAMKNLVGMAEFKQSLMPVPSLKEEQTAIATILSDMDAEIQALEQRLGKTRQIKQGMMQELLTGKTRLIKGEAHG